MKISQTLLILFLTGLLSACASISSGSKRQFVLIRSTPPGAPIEVSGDTVGFTPEFVEVERGRKMSVALDTADGPQKVSLYTHYRWLDSFWSGFVFLYFAPVAWVTDLITGAAWEADFSDLEPIRLKPSDRRRAYQAKRESFATVAPPLAPDMSLSDAGGMALEESLLKRRKKVRPFEATLPIFTANDYDFDGRPRERERGQIYHLIQSDFLYESYIESNEEGLVLHAEAVNVFTQERSDAHEILLKPATTIDRIYSLHSWWSRLIPNTIGLTFAEDYLTFQQGAATYRSHLADDEPWWASSIRYLSALDVSNLPQRRYGRSGRTLWGFVPTFRLSRQHVKISNLPPGPDGTEETYTRWAISGGYGPELGYQISRHYLYLNAIPVLRWSRLWWKYQGQKYYMTETKMALQAEVGYVFFFNSNWQVRLFSRTSADAEQSWSNALQTRLSGNQPLSVTAVTSGISIGYRFSPKIDKAL